MFLFLHLFEYIFECFRGVDDDEIGEVGHGCDLNADGEEMGGMVMVLLAESKDVLEL